MSNWILEYTAVNENGSTEKVAKTFRNRPNNYRLADIMSYESRKVVVGPRVVQELDPMVLPSGAELRRTRSTTGAVTTEVPKEHRDEYTKVCWERGIEAGKALAKPF